MNAALSPDERLSMTLRGLYQSYGYRQYKVSKFEEYDLYAQNRNFLDGEQILTFSDTNGRLMALKPDITLSIIKNTRDDRRLRKLWYTENVYRVPRNAYGFQEIMQTGLECIGPVDLYAMGEVLALAAESLRAIRPEYALTVSHMGVLTGILAGEGGLTPAASGEVLAAMEAKNLHALRALRDGGVLAPETASLLESLSLLGGEPGPALERLLALPLPEASRRAAEELSALYDVVSVFGRYNIRLDFSVINDTDYYNGLIFRGFIDGVSACVLSGGRYDHLLERMGKTGGAVGFAVYISELERLLAQPRDYDVDVLLCYGPDSDPIQVAGQARAIVRAGQTVRVQRAGDAAVTYRRKIGPDGKEAD